MRNLDLRLPPRPARTCRVRAGRGALGLLVEDLAANPPAGRYVVVSDSRVAPLHAAPLAARLREAGLRVDLLTFPEGEPGKSRAAKERLEDGLFDLGVGGDVALVAVGGGVTGDLAGFLAATWHRGVPVIQAPTSLLAMVDSALGGKTGVNLPGGKNLVGAYHQPLAVYADLATLETLSEARYVDGFAEMVKSAVIADASLFAGLESEAPALIRRDEQALEPSVAACLRIKSDFVMADERDAGRRQALNLGHTVGHALEIVSRHELSHGQAVAIGTVAELHLARELRRFPDADLERVVALLSTLGLPTEIPAGVAAPALIEAARRDKKSRDGRIRCALPCELGRMPGADDVTEAVEESTLEGVLDRLTA